MKKSQGDIGTFLKEDGSLDVERINKLSLEEYIDVMGDLTEEQVEEYFSTIPINESIGPTIPVEVDYRELYTVVHDSPVSS